MPKWATAWADTPQGSSECESGKGLAEQCNLIGKLGLWVMKKTEPRYNSPDSSDEEARVKNCMNLPGWALHECLRMREKEANGQ